MYAGLLVMLVLACRPGPQDTADTSLWGDRDGDGVAALYDCDDEDPDVSPLVEEICNGIDDDCDGEIDEQGALGVSAFHPDADGDGFGEPDQTTWACEAPGGMVADGTDCDDRHADVHPGADEHCDDRDEDCDEEVDEEPVDGDTWYPDRDVDGYGDQSEPTPACERPSIYTLVGGDCDDTDPTISPAQVERCDELDVDEDCDGLVEDADPDATGQTVWYLDEDGDGYGQDEATVLRCDGGEGIVAEAGDCDDGESAISPGATEICDNGIDDDCDGFAGGGCGPWGEADLNDADALRYGELRYDYAGAVAGAGDVDGDGHDDVIIGAWGSNLGKVDGGQVYLVLGPVTGSADLSHPDARLLGTTEGDGAGWVVDGAGDLDQDGYNDVLVGAPWVGGDDTGAVYVVHGPFSSTTSLRLADAFLWGTGGLAGHSLAGGGDADGDGYPDLLVGAPELELDSEEVGAAYLVLGPPEDGALSDADVVWMGEEDGDLLGAVVAWAGDTDGDGLDEALVGAPGVDGEAGAGAGEAGLFLGSTVQSAAGLDDADTLFMADQASDELGTGLASAGDVDGDGYADVLVGAPGWDGSGSELGAAYLFLGPVASGDVHMVSADAVLEGSVSAGEVGAVLSPAGDTDADGYDDLLVAGWMVDDGTTVQAGAVYLIGGSIGPSGSVDLETEARAILRGDSAVDFFGARMDALGDLDADGYDDVGVGSMREDTPYNSSGVTAIFLGGPGF